MTKVSERGLAIYRKYGNKHFDKSFHSEWYYDCWYEVIKALLERAIRK